MSFDPGNHIVKLCLQAIALEEGGHPKEALTLFLRAWNESTTDLEKFLAAHYVARRQETTADRIKWLEIALEFASRSDDLSARSALATLYAMLAEAHEEGRDPENARKYRELSESAGHRILDPGPFYHGTRADLRIGELLTPGRNSNYQPDLVMNHVYFTALVNGAGLAAALATGEGRERVYIVEPTGSFENDPNVTNKKFPGNPTRSYRTSEPLKITGELTDWVKRSPEELRQWRERLAKSKGEIVN